MQTTLDSALPWWTAGPVLGLVIVSLPGSRTSASGADFL